MRRTSPIAARLMRRIFFPERRVMRAFVAQAAENAGFFAPKMKAIARGSWETRVETRPIYATNPGQKQRRERGKAAAVTIMRSPATERRPAQPKRNRPIRSPSHSEEAGQSDPLSAPFPTSELKMTRSGSA